MSGVLLSWPSTGGGLLLWAHLVVAWALVVYLAGADSEVSNRHRGGAVSPRWRRFLGAGLLGGFVVFVAGAGARGSILAITTAALAMWLPTLRTRAAERRASAELELAAATVLVSITGVVIAWGSADLQLARILIALPLPPARLALILFLVAALVFLGSGGTFVVRGVLEKVGTLPGFVDRGGNAWRVRSHIRYDTGRDVWMIESRGTREAPEGQGETREDAAIDTGEISRGRVIGVVERVLLAMLAMTGSYGAIGFVVAAKGLVRAREFENRNYAEYFLVGTLVSTTLALGIGTLLRIAAGHLWNGG